MNTSETSHPASKSAPEGLRLAILLEQGGQPVTWEAVTDRDLADQKAEVWFCQFLRCGLRDVALGDLTTRVVPLLGQGKTACTRFRLEAIDPSGTTGWLEFTMYSLENVAERASKRLMADGLLKAGDLYWYRLEPAGLSPGQPAGAAGGAAGGITLRENTPPPTFHMHPLADMVAGARGVDLATNEAAYPVIFTAGALAKAEAHSRKGARMVPPVETGCLLLGPLCACPATDEVFAVVTDVLELRDAENETYSLTPSGRTWKRIQAVIRALRRDPARRHLRILGQAHGHNFPPDDLALGGSIALTDTAFASKDDQRWMGAVFSGQPYMLSLIHGLDASGRPVAKLFGLEDARLVQRGYYVTSREDLTLAAESSLQASHEGKVAP